MTLEQEFNSRVNGFLRRTGLSPTALGLKALGDPNLMRQVHGGRSPSLRTADRLLAYIAADGLDAVGARAPPARSRRPGSATRARRTREGRAMTRKPREKRTRPTTRFLRVSEVQAQTGLARSTIYAWSAQGRSPPGDPVELTRGALDRSRREGVAPRAGLGRPGRRRGRRPLTENKEWEQTMRTLLTTVMWTLAPGALWAQGTSPWVDAVDELQTQFTGPIARGLALIAIVVGGLMFAFGEGGSKRTLVGIIFGIGMAVGAVNFLGWLF